MNWLYENSDVLERASDDDTGAITTRIRIASEKKGRLLSRLERHHLRPI